MGVGDVEFTGAPWFEIDSVDGAGQCRNIGPDTERDQSSYRRHREWRHTLRSEISGSPEFQFFALPESQPPAMTCCGPAWVHSAAADIRGEYRYALTRVWDPALPMITFVLLNPSTAHAMELDPTLQRCIGFAKREGYGGMVILNLYAFRPKDPKVMMAAIDSVGPENDRMLADVTGSVVAGWGTNANSAA